MNEDMNEIDRVAKRLQEGVMADSTIERMYVDGFIRYLKLHSPRHLSNALAWRINQKTGKFTSYKANAVEELSGRREAAFSPTGYWFPNIHVLAATPYHLDGEEVYPTKKIFDFAKKSLGVESTNADIIVV